MRVSCGFLKMHLWGVVGHRFLPAQLAELSLEFNTVCFSFKKYAGSKPASCMTYSFAIDLTYL
jgi:hypothetical protein